jgi:hypothetical protein
MPNISNIAREQLPGITPIGPVVVLDLAECAAHFNGVRYILLGFPQIFP